MKDSCQLSVVSCQLARMNPASARSVRSRVMRFAFQVLLVVLVSILAWAQQPTPWNKLTFPPLPAFQPQHATRIQLANGMVIFLQPDHELPLISASATIRGGSISEPAAKTGMVSLYGEGGRTGGTKTQTGDQMDDVVEARAAKDETGDGGESTSISLNCLKGDFHRGFKRFVHLWNNP